LRSTRRYIFNVLGATAAALVFFCLAGLLWLSHQQAHAYLHPRRLAPPNGEYLTRAGIPYQEVTLLTSDGLRLSAWYTAPQNGSLILVAHGYGDRRSEEFYALFAQHGYGVIAWDFRGHGSSDGELVTLGYFETLDVEAALDFALAQPGVKHIGGWGGSMGAATMIRAAAIHPEIEALVADSAFTTLNDELNLRVPFPILNPLIRYFAESESGLGLEAVRPIDDIGQIAPRPVLLIQGLDDGMVPPDSVQRLYAEAGEPRQLWTEPGVPHLNMFAYFRTRYTKRVIKFFDTYLTDYELVPD
jgi:fermentation-respiration switch protein FrsA (DUF1100 family)